MQAEEALKAARLNESQLVDRVRKLEELFTQASEAVTERENQCQALEQLNDETQRTIESLSSRQAAHQQELDAIVAEKAAAMAAADSAGDRIADLNAELDSANARLRDVKRQNADLEMKNLQLVKTQKKLEEDTEGLYMGLEAKQQELELVCRMHYLALDQRLMIILQVKRKFGVRGTAGATPAQGSTTKAQNTGFKVPHARRSSISSVADTDDGLTVPKGIPSKILRPRISVATPTPAASTLTRHSSLTNHARKTSSSSTLASVAANQAGAAPTRPPGLRRQESISDAESVSSSAAPTKRVVRAPPTSFKRSSVSPPAELSSSRTSILKRAPSIPSSLKPTPEEAEKENYVPGSNLPDDLTTPKPLAKRRVMLAA